MSRDRHARLPNPLHPHPRHPRTGGALVVLVAALVVALAAPALAHADRGARGRADRTYGVGVAVGLAVTSMSTEDSDFDFDNRVRANIGVCGQFQVNDTFAVQPEFYYAQKGAESDILGIEFDFDFDYAEVHVLGVFTIPTRSLATPYVFVGPSIGVLLRSEVSAEINGQTESDEIDNVEDTEVSVIAGIGLRVPTGAGAVTLDARYQHGLTDVADGSVDDDGRVYHRSGSLMVGFLF